MIKRRKKHLFGIVIVLFLLVSIVSSSTGIIGFRANASPPQTPINLVSDTWNTGSAQPGDNNAILNVTIQNLGGTPIIGVNEQIDLSSVNIRNTTGGLTATSIVPLPEIPSGSLGVAPFELDILSNATYSAPVYVPLDIYYQTSTGGSINEQVFSLPLVITQPMLLTVAGSSWSSPFAENKSSNGGVAGDQGDLLTLQVRNTNQFTIHSLSATLFLANSPFTNVTGGNEVTSVSSAPLTVAPTLTATVSFSMNISPNASIGSVPLSVLFTYFDQWNGLQSMNGTVSVPIYGSTSLSVVSLDDNVVVGASSVVRFLISNIGTAPIYSPSIVLTVPQPLTVTINGTFAAPGITLAPSADMIYEATISTGPNSPEGVYPATLAFTYVNEFGAPAQLKLSFGFTLAASVDLVIQDLSFIQTLDNLTASGVILNEGQGSAFYTQGTATLIGSNNKTMGQASTYLGEIDPNTPVPFSILIPFSAQSNPSEATVNIVLNYQNNFGTAGQLSSNTSIKLQSQSELAQTTTTTSHPILNEILNEILRYSTYIVSGIIVLIIVLSFLFVRVRRKHAVSQAEPKKVI